MTEDEEDLIGLPPAKRGPGRPPKSKSKAAPGTDWVAADRGAIATLKRPVTIKFLSVVLSMDTRTVIKRLETLPPVHTSGTGQPTYDFKEAITYLVTPAASAVPSVSTGRKMSARDLPSSLQKDVWDAKLKEQKWRRLAGELWPTDAVLEVLGEAFKRLKTSTQLWVDQITDRRALSDEVREDLMRNIETLQTDLHRTLIEMPKLKATQSQLGEIDDDE